MCFVGLAFARLQTAHCFLSVGKKRKFRVIALGVFFNNKSRFYRPEKIDLKNPSVSVLYVKKTDKSVPEVWSSITEFGVLPGYKINVDKLVDVLFRILQASRPHSTFHISKKGFKYLLLLF